MLRKMRGALGTALTWAVGWAGTAFAVSSTMLFVFGSGPWPRAAIPVSMVAGILGLAGGATFSLVLGTFTGGRRLSDLRASRMALWGAAAGLLAPIGITMFALASGAHVHANGLAFATMLIGGLGAATAGGSVKLAQSAARRLGETDETWLIG